ncbi:acyl-CoA thioesterase [Fulvivirgaceae bacterium LMO-SS25]
MSKTANPRDLGFDYFTPIQVRMTDIDGQAHVNNGTYYQYFEHARATFLYETAGWDFFQDFIVIVNSNIDYLTPILIMDKPQIWVKCTKIGNSSFHLSYLITGAENAEDTIIYAKATSIQVSVEQKTGKPVAIPEKYRSKLLEALEHEKKIC